MKDRIVQQVIQQFQERSEVGIKKYGTTLEDNNEDDFLTHLKQELMDAILYIEKLQDLKRISQIREKANKIGDQIFKERKR